ncbi:MAG: hypothetical protein KAS32_14100 [Candidatus Peribacteraceae bacterium]|nr:hypothetical protein [Candidatus Peribacteraceae bacterium]
MAQRKPENIPSDYRAFLEMLKIEFGDFLRLAETGRTVRHASLKSRKKSIRIRELLKEFRNVSLHNDDKINKIMQDAKKRIYDEGE